MRAVDNKLPQILQGFINSLATVLSAVILIICVTPALLVFIVPMCYMYNWSVTFFANNRVPEFSISIKL